MFRVGLGYDVHEFDSERKLIIGGIEIPHTKGLKGHSDADVLLHAITDAMLGACALGDIGKLFPDTDMAFKDADSKKLLKEAYEAVKKEGFVINNVDATIIAEKPKFRPHIDKMREVIAQVFDVDVKYINVKATTSEKLGFTGREEGIAAQAIVSLTGESSS
ncbi:2-C-methyl-D-erythritol 2,4-cyclodiphosphate synthase [Staphylococcus massiliensis]|uniref:2-C-methyl-D-erythritol 2,4-cyclodiphosphate synthase n=1 Tax=Staphylococcus massiliensis S46 TaxID=1229783 RepID=K9AJI0_9STAP|nr:2-C-methyl-D-erythritol 2,4-cyclodiphosphate synthase [Staphylococcus massiliensis]EKU47399.1 2-C-methyl-D-erythritol 2,4-cyclo diphosphate synthase [Staphylococcus massiliensis S46]MCG3400317.1 2-C-methyl-D-erythritol 2,4-cyclodiphosphate synthase [Staphylococcus massiliensis]MCG3401991.1 2-C-methyl-D-erythritol 2,4-cyclodiphosphate synthase [Staphylococcus massiliensis]MCG3412345.1 2-C-methyl-D-erythritol 2,4-cyclodiphosphate synthase [Staphylococcus massiliensis]PNZ99131.1 2-C-methyl-D-e